MRTRFFYQSKKTVKLLLIVVLLFIRCKQTKYCPSSHIAGDLTTCEIMVSNDSIILIQHSELDINKYYFELKNLKKNNSIFFALHSDITQLGKKGYKAMVIKNNIILIKFHESDSWIESDGKEIEAHLF